MRKKYKRIFTIVLDSLGVGAMDDAASYGDEGVDTLGHIAEHIVMEIPHLRKMGIGNLRPLSGIEPVAEPMSFATRGSSLNMPFSKWNARLLSLKCFSTTIIAAVCAITVAHAAPAMPISNTKMNIGSSMVLNTTVNMVRAIAFFGFPEERIAALHRQIFSLR